MQIDALYLENFRCLIAAELTFSSGVNCIVGDNASGKTSLLEAIYMLGRGESFRPGSLLSAIRHNSDALLLRSRLGGGGLQSHRLSARITTSGTQFKLDSNASPRRYDLITALPLQHIDPNVHRLLESGPRHRRHFLDWGVFHVEHAFFPAWRRYRRALKQRNHALRHRWPRHEVIAWDAELVQQGEIVDACRRRYLQLIRQRLPETAIRLIGDGDLELRYRSGWRGDEGLGSALAAGLASDLKAGFTQHGPHRADMRVQIASRKAQDWVSRGQQKLLTAALMLTQAQVLYDQRGIRPVLLLDDMAAELGETYRKTLASAIRRLNVQCFITFLARELIPSEFSEARLFHVKQGGITVFPDR